jgi:KDO2-lipid IV(A) lauroyltransferase
MRERLEYVAAWATLKFFGLLPRPLARWIAARFGALLFRIRPAWRRTALFNLKLAFPESTEGERKRVVASMVRNLGWLLAEFAHLPAYTRQHFEQVVVREGFENLEAARGQGRGVLVLAAHLGAWELQPFLHGLYWERAYFLVRPIRNARVNALVNAYRCVSGCQFIDKNRSARAILKVLRQGGTVGILVDQNTTPDEAVFVDFFGVPAATTAGLARLARSSGAPVVPMYLFWDAGLRKYRGGYGPALNLKHTDDKGGDIHANTRLFNQILEDFIRRFPDQWFWVHRRWRNRPPGEGPIYPDERGAQGPPPRK